MMLRPTAPLQLRRAALEIFSEALKSVDAAEAMRLRVRLDGSHLRLFDVAYNLESNGLRVYAVAMGKAALAMAAALDEILCGRLAAGVVAAPAPARTHPPLNPPLLSSCWKIFQGGHPLPNDESLAAAHAAIELMRRADRERSLILFLISGGASATFEWPRDERTTLEDLREANRLLISCGARIAEINSVRCAFSAVKGGRLSALAPRAGQLSLIVSDTNPGEESAVASGPTFALPEDSPDPREVISHYRLEKSLPPSIMRAVNEAAAERPCKSDGPLPRQYLLLDNRRAIEAAARAARRRGFAVEAAYDIIEQPVAEGCAELLTRLYDGRSRDKGEGFCLISGGEFACPVRGDGTGGRNAETVLRAALEVETRRRQAAQSDEQSHVVMLSAGTDGIDGNSPAAGAIADETTLERASAKGLEARNILERSDAYTLFNSLGDAIVTGATGTNVRDLRIMLMR